MDANFALILQQLEQSEECFFITGKAGTGKSTLLRAFKEHTRKRLAVLAPTGIAAMNVGGQTIHSFFGLPARPWTDQDLRRRNATKLFEALDAIIIDEVSMLRADQLDGLDRFLRLNRQDPRPFGGVQMLFFGDLFQLPPVIASQEEALLLNERYDSPYFFSAQAIKNQEVYLQVIELQEVFRQADRAFIRLLDAVRTNTLDWDEIEELNSRVKPNFQASDYYVTLSARNREVDAINEAKLQALSGEEMSYIADSNGQIPGTLPAETPLRLRLGAQVMFLKNDPKRRYFNGSIGKVVELDNDKVVVELPGKEKTRRVEVERFEWELHKHELQSGGQIGTRVVGKYKQFPLRLAWAITIHKSQGQTFDRVLIDLGKGGAFEYGQTYVALSRCRSLQGIVLRQPLQSRDIRVDAKVVDFYMQYGR